MELSCEWNRVERDKAVLNLLSDKECARRCNDAFFTGDGMWPIGRTACQTMQIPMTALPIFNRGNTCLMIERGKWRHTGNHRRWRGNRSAATGTPGCRHRRHMTIKR